MHVHTRNFVPPIRTEDWKTSWNICLTDAWKLFRRPHDAVIRVYDEAGNVIQTLE